MRALQVIEPIAVEVQFKRTAHADEAEKMPGAERMDDCTVRGQAADAVNALRFVRTCIKLGATAQSDPMR